MADLELDESKLQNEETANAFPIGVKLLNLGLIVWGIYYLWTYSPWGGGWTQEADLQGSVSTGVNIGHTIAYTAIPAVVILVLAVAMARRKAKR